MNLPKHITVRKGKYLYFRKGARGKTTSLPWTVDDWDTPDFWSQYALLLKGFEPAPKGYNFKYLFNSYRGSDRYQTKAERTKADYEKVMEYVEKVWGDLDPRKVQRSNIVNMQSTLAPSGVRFANYVPQVLSVVFEHAIDLGWRQDNPAFRVRKLATPKERMQEHVPWTDEAVARWRKDAKPLPRFIFELGIGSVQRPGDLPRFRWSDYDGDALRIAQGKTGKALYLPCTEHLRTALDAAPRRALTILSKGNTQPLPYRRMAQIMRDERERLGTLRHDLHALRYRGVMELAWAGCDDDEIMSYSGHNTKAMVQQYAGLARQMMRAKQAREKRR